jgi:N-acetylglucosamine kinase-like BadF-type ATPase
MKRQPAYLAIEGGGSRARAALLHDGSIRVGVSVEGLNPVDIGYDEFAARLKMLTLPLLEPVEPPPSAIRASVALAGAGNREVRKACRRIVEEILRAHVPAVKVMVMTDVDALVESCLSGLDGIVLIAGTGSVCVAVKKRGRGRGRTRGKRRERFQVGGWGGYLDSGSGFMMGAALLMAALRTADGRQPPTVAVDLLCEDYGIDIGDVPERFLPPKRDEVAALAPVVLRAYQARCALARAVVRECVGDLVEMAVTAADRAGLGRDIPIFASGGLFRSPVIMRLFKRRITRHLPKAVVRNVSEPLINILELARKA